MTDQLPNLIGDGSRGVEAVPVLLVGPDGTIYQAAGTASVGNPGDVAWNGTDPNPTLISIMKACHAQLATIAANTGM